MATVIIKDQRRIGRDVVEAGLLKRTFDEYHVRFKARTLKELAAAQKEGKALTPEESERLEAHKSRKKIAREKLVQQAATDPAAAAELAKKRAHQSQATKKSRQKMYEEAATGNPEAVECYENYLVTRRKSYHRKKQEAERTA